MTRYFQYLANILNNQEVPGFGQKPVEVLSWRYVIMILGGRHVEDIMRKIFYARHSTGKYRVISVL